MSYDNIQDQLFAHRGTFNPKSATAQLLFTTDNYGLYFYPLFVFIRATASSSITVAATVGLGVTSATYVDILAAAIQTNTVTVRKFAVPQLVIAGTAIPPNTGVYANVTVAATGTSQTLEARLIGFYA